MKKLLVTFCLLISAVSIFANKIDSLSTAIDVKRFVHQFIPKFYYESADEDWRVKTWQKADLNDDNLTDLIVTEANGHNKYNFAVVTNSDGSYKMSQINYNTEAQYSTDGESIDIIKIANKPYVVFHGWTVMSWREKLPRTDTLIYKYDSFIEYNKSPSHHQIVSVLFTSGGNWTGLNNASPKNDDPDKSLFIDRNSTAVCRVYRHTGGTYVFTSDSKRPARNPEYDLGIFNGTINENELKELYGLIDYINIKNLKNSYAVSWSEEVDSFIHIEFADGTTKDIADYGGRGTFGLQAFWSKLYSLIKTTDWK